MYARRLSCTTHSTSFINRIQVTIITKHVVDIFCFGVLRGAQDTGKISVFMLRVLEKIVQWWNSAKQKWRGKQKPRGKV